MGLWLVVATLLSQTIWTLHTMAGSITTVLVDPPAHIRISDLGQLGQLGIHWARPSSLQGLVDCAVWYQLRYYNTYTHEWTVIRTSRQSYQAQFDLEKPVQVKLKTLLKGKCTNRSEHQSEEVELLQAPELTGPAGSRITGFSCVYHQWEFMDCTWERGPEEPPNSRHQLFYWHREKDKPEECPQYIPSYRIRMGCRFPQESLLESSDFNVCVNGSSPVSTLRPAFFSMEVQNLVKPAEVTCVNLTKAPDGVLRFDWAAPAGRTPAHCLEYDVETSGGGGALQEWQQMNRTEETTFKFDPAEEGQRICFRVRSKVHKYCADNGFWSDWSRSQCLPEHVGEEDDAPSDRLLIWVLIAVFLATLVLSLSWWMARRMLSGRREVKCALLTLLRPSAAQTYHVQP